MRLWEQDAAAALASGLPGLITLSPLMRGATTELVEEAAQTLITQVAPPVQGELLTALGIFAEPLLDTTRFIRLVTKGRLMSSSLITYLFKDQMDEFAQKEAEFAQKEAEYAQREATMVQALQQTAEDALAVRFPTVPFVLAQRIRSITDTKQLVALHKAILNAPDQAAAEQLLAAAGA